MTQNDFLASKSFEYGRFNTCHYEPANKKGIKGFIFYHNDFTDLMRANEVKDFDKEGFCMATPDGLERIEFSDCKLIKDEE